VDFIGRSPPDVVCLLGDICDFYTVSDHLRDPARKDNLQDDLDATVAVLKTIRKACPNARLIYHEGNHEDRLSRYCMRHASALRSLRDLRLPRQLRFADLAVEFYTLEHPHRIGGLTYTHGNIIRPHSAYSARGMVEKVAGSVIHGHTHRLGSHHVTGWNHEFAAWENGCLCRLDPCEANRYTGAGHPNWQQGFSIIHYAKKSWRRWFYHVEQVRIVGTQTNTRSRSYVRDGQLYTAGTII
jgi:hypothetical protein